MAPDETDDAGEADAPLPQRLLDSIWLLAGAALLFWALSYVAWGLIDLMLIPGG